MKNVTLTKAEAIQAETAIAPTRDWWGKDTGTLRYAIDPQNWPKDEEGKPLVEIDFPIVDDAARAILVGLFPDKFEPATEEDDLTHG